MPVNRLTLWCQSQNLHEKPQHAEAVLDTEFVADDYPWTIEPARHFSGVLDSRPPAAIPCWSSKALILRAIRAALTSPEGVIARRGEGCKADGTGGGISIKTVMAVAEEDAGAADSGTGRNIQTAHETVARRLAARDVKISWSSVRKARRLLRRLGFQVVVEEGRYLTQTERLAWEIAHPQKPGSTGRRYIPCRKASTRVFTMSAAAVQKTGHLPRRGSLTPHLKKEGLTKKRSRAVLGESIPKKSEPQNRRRSMQPPPRPLAVQKIAAHLKLSMGWLAKVNHVNTISDTLMLANVDPKYWTGRQLINALNDRSRQRGWTMPQEITNPIGYLTHLLSDLDPAKSVEIYHHPSRAAEAARSTLAAQRALEEQRSPENRAKQSAGWRRVREALRQVDRVVDPRS